MFPTYRAWLNMRYRCLSPSNKDYPSYGGRGITICERWDSYKSFLADMGECPPGLQLDRIDNEKGYSLNNCRWATRREQANNTRRNRWVTVDGRTQTIAQWARELNVPYGRIYDRLRIGADVLHRALTQRLKEAP